MTDQELKKRIRRFFFASDKFCENGLSEYWLQEMKFNREWILKFLEEEERRESDKLQMTLWQK